MGLCQKDKAAIVRIRMHTLRIISNVRLHLRFINVWVEYFIHKTCKKNKTHVKLLHISSARHEGITAATVPRNINGLTHTVVLHGYWLTPNFFILLYYFALFFVDENHSTWVTAYIYTWNSMSVSYCCTVYMIYQSRLFHTTSC